MRTRQRAVRNPARAESRPVLVRVNQEWVNGHLIATDIAADGSGRGRVVWGEGQVEWFDEYDIQLAAR